MTVLSPSYALERATRYVKGYTGRSARRLLLSKVPGARGLAFRQPDQLTMEEAQVMMSTRDLTDPSTGPHAMQLLVESAKTALGVRWGISTQIHRANLIVDVNDNYGRLHFDKSAILRDLRYAYRVSNNLMLRTHLSSLGPNLIKAVAQQQLPADFDKLFVMPGLAYRRETVDRFHGATFHQVDFWRLAKRENFTKEELQEFIAVVMGSWFPGMQYRSTPTKHPYTRLGRQVDILFESAWLEIGECGVIAKNLLGQEGLDTDEWSGMLFGLGIDRAIMVRKGVSDIRLLSVSDEKVQAQFLNLDPWRPVPLGRQVTRELQLQLTTSEDEDSIGDHIHEVLGESARLLQKVHILHRHEGRLSLQVTFQALQEDLTEAAVDLLCSRLATKLQNQLAG